MGGTGSTPRPCRAWRRSLSATGSPDGFDRVLEEATTYLDRAETQPEPKPWVGIGLFNQAKLTAYRGGGLMRLGRHAQAQTELRDALHRLDPVLRKYRCTAHIDLAQAYGRGGDPDASAEELTHAVGIIAETLHANSLRRTTDLYEGIRAARRGLILDFGGVVTADFYAALRGFCRREHLPDEAIVRALRDTAEGSAALARAECGQISQQDFEAVLAGLLGVEVEGLFGRALADLRPGLPVLDQVAQARAAGIATAVLSNSWGAGKVDPYAGYDLPDRFDTVVISDQVGLRKPDPAIYQLTAHRLGVPAAGCVFVDDTAHNLPAAEALGLIAVHFTDVGEGVAEIRRLLDLPIP